jgi:hypothetical protein
MFDFGFLPCQMASTTGEGVFHSRESEQGVGSLTPPYAMLVRNSDSAALNQKISPIQLYRRKRPVSNRHSSFFCSVAPW